MNLGDIFKRYLMREKESGMLSIKFDGVEYLFKMYINENCEVVYMTFGTYKNEECLDKIKGLKPSEHFFLKGVKPPSISGVPLTERVMNIIGIDAISSTAEGIPEREDILFETIKKVEDDFVDIIGPIGRVIIDNLYSSLSYKRGDKMRSDNFARFMESLIKELPPSEQTRFKAKYKIM